MQPPPRKGNYAKFLKNLHTEQLAKLSLKNQHECDLLEDIRTFTIKRSAIEKSYSEALLKISTAYLNKKIPNIPDLKYDGSDERSNMWNVWRTVLEENEKLAKARLAAVEVFQQQIADDAKLLRVYKMQHSKKHVDQLAVVQKELQTCVQDLDKTKKLYFDEEHSAHDVRDKAKDLEEKLKKKKGSFFQSITSLQKNSARVSTRRDQLEEKSAGARNDYILCLAATNAHQNRYFVVDLQLCMSSMEQTVYEKVAEYLTLMGRTELLTCSAMQNSFGKIKEQAQQLTREYNLQCCYLHYPVLKQHIQYEFEACDNDPIDHVTADQESAQSMLSKEARRWATKIAREANTVRENVRKLQLYNALRDAGQKVDPNDPNGPDLETKIDELRQTIRRAETAKMKAQARIECLRAGGVNVDEWMQEAETLSVQDIPRSASSLSVRTDASGVGDHPSSDSFYDSDATENEPVHEPVERQRTTSKPDSEPDGGDDGAEVDAMLEQERQRIEQLTAGWDDPIAVDWGSEEPTVHSHGVAPRDPPTSQTPLLKCTALYSYTAQNPDELSIVENEQLEVVGDGDGDGWLRARNYKGEEGFVPHNYLDIEPPPTQLATSVDYTMSSSSPVIAPPADLPPPVSKQEDDTFTAASSEQNHSPEEPSVISAVHQVNGQLDSESITEPDIQQDGSIRAPTVTYCIALYDYEGEEDQELTFDEGEVIRVLNKMAHGVDDGWWLGEIDGRVGNFPSLVVEECDEFGEPLECDWDISPPASAPPIHTPPEAPPDFLLETEVIVCQPTPHINLNENDIDDNNKIKNENNKKIGFAMEMTQDNKDKYGQQFTQKDPPTGIPCVIIEAEDDQGSNEENEEDGDDCGLGVAQIVITAATPMTEESDHAFPPPEDEEEENHEENGHHGEEIIEEIKEEKEVNPEENTKIKSVLEEYRKELNGDDDDVIDDQPTDSNNAFPISSSSEGETTGPSTAENSQSQPSEDPMPSEVKQVVGGRASIPDELEPHQLARLQDLKESNA